jgi:hypothetical protein
MLRVLLAVAAVAAVAAAAAGQARADLPYLFDFCKTATADRTVVLGPGVPKVDAVSSFATYAENPCPRWIVDIVVPTTSGAPGYFPEFGLAAGIQSQPLSATVCAGVEQNVRVYRKSAHGGEFVFVGGGRTSGVWSPGGGFVAPHCEYVKAPGYVDLPWFSPPALTTAVYRVAVSASAYDGDFQLPVRVRGWHPAVVA